MSRIEREKKTIRQMITIYCRHHHSTRDTLCPECNELYQYALKRLSHCPFGPNKNTCRKCTIHCYAPAQRQAVRQVMRYAGPRMLLYHPIAAIRHLWDERK